MEMSTKGIEKMTKLMGWALTRTQMALSTSESGKTTNKMEKEQRLGPTELNT